MINRKKIINLENQLIFPIKNQIQIGIIKKLKNIKKNKNDIY